MEIEQLPDVHFGEADATQGNGWESYDEPDADDAELGETPKDVVMMLGFDPKEIEEGPSA